MESKLQKIHAQGAGIDVGSRQFFIGIENQEVKSFDTFTNGCHQVVEYLQQHSVTSVALALVSFLTNHLAVNAVIVAIYSKLSFK